MIELIHGDCLEKMKDIPDKSIDMILTDLPFGTTSCKWDVVIPFNKYVQIGKKVIYEQEYVFDKMKSGVSYKEALEDFLSISKDGLWDNYKRIIKDHGAIVLFGSEPFSSYLRMSNIKWYKYDWVWNKPRGSGFQIVRYRPLVSNEYISVFGKNTINYYPQMRDREKPRISKNNGSTRQMLVSNGKAYESTTPLDKKYPITSLYYSNEINKDKVHPTQKPVALLEYLIKTYTLEGETVLDNCMGSGSTAIACLNTNRNFIGIEKDDTYFEIAEKRIEEMNNIKEYIL